MSETPGWGRSDTVVGDHQSLVLDQALWVKSLAVRRVINVELLGLGGPHVVRGASRWCQQWRSHLPLQEMWVQSLGREDPLEEGMASHGQRWARQAVVHGVAESWTLLKLLGAHARTRVHTHAYTHTRAVKLLPFSPPLPCFKGLLCVITVQGPRILW